MNLNLPAPIRKGLYILTVIGTPIVTYLATKGTIDDVEVALWTAEVMGVSALAAFNTPSQHDRLAQGPPSAPDGAGPTE